MAEMYKIKNNLNAEIIHLMFERRKQTYNLRNFHKFDRETKRTVKMDLET